MRDPIRVTTFTRWWKRLRRSVAPSEWIVWLLGLKRSGGDSTDHGLILVQIDGLSKTQLERAIRDGRMPFVKSLLENEHYLNHAFYSGLPSSTPAVQGELYYGTRTAVPAFGFRDHHSGRLVRMFESEVASHVEARISENTTGLLTGGSSYCNNYSGGAREVHFCATSFGWSEFLNTVNPLKLFLVVLLNFWMFFRVAGLMLLELVLATFGFVRGVLSGREFWQELIMIPARVVVVVLLRELVTVGACYDSARGLPIIHLNLLGYDEQAHRRGPQSRFAHWTLTGIDHSIRRIWNAAHRGAGREYDFWVFSDHGQEVTKPYQLAHGQLIQQVVAESVDECCQKSAPDQQQAARLPSRANWLGVGWLVSMMFGEQDHDLQTRSAHVQTVTSGPLGFAYFLTPEVKKRADEIAIRLVNQASVPMVIKPTSESCARIFTANGIYSLPSDSIQVFGSDHPFLDDIAEDLIAQANHEDAGELMLVGWTHECESTSFVLQNGAHAGPGIEETRGFALLPNDTSLPISSRRYLRPNDLRLSALRFLGRDESGQQSRPQALFPVGQMRVMTYNVHACVGMDGQLSPERVARVIAQSGANIVCLQELDVFRHRSGNRDQARAIARYLEMSHQFHPAWHIEEEQFGNAILTRFPMRIVEAKPLHQHKSDRSRRSALWAEIDITDELSLQVINTHLSIYPAEQRIQSAQLVEEWIQPASLLGPVIVCGDFNARPDSETSRILCSDLHDVESFDSRPTRSTLFSPFPVSRVDHIFVSDGISASCNHVIQSRLAKVASDHLPLVSDLKLLNPSVNNSNLSGNVAAHLR